MTQTPRHPDRWTPDSECHAQSHSTSASKGKEKEEKTPHLDQHVHLLVRFTVSLTVWFSVRWTLLSRDINHSEEMTNSLCWNLTCSPTWFLCVSNTNQRDFHCLKRWPLLNKWPQCSSFLAWPEASDWKSHMLVCFRFKIFLWIRKVENGPIGPIRTVRSKKTENLPAGGWSFSSCSAFRCR